VKYNTKLSLIESNYMFLSKNPTVNIYGLFLSIFTTIGGALTVLAVLFAGFMANIHTVQAQVVPQSITIGNGNPFAILQEVNRIIAEKGLPYTPVNTGAPFVRTDGGSGGGFRWNANSGTLHMPTLSKVCEILGYRTLVEAGCSDSERSGLYPNGKCNFHTPENNLLTRFVNGKFVTERATPKYEKTWVTTITCKDPIEVQSQCANGIDDDGDGAIDMNDFSCSSATDNDESNPKAQCQDGIDNDGDGKIDMADPGCSSKQDNTENTDGTTATTNNNVNTVTEQKITVVVANNNEDNKDNIEFSKSDDRETVRQGETLIYKLRVRNNRENDITNVKIVDRLPSYLIPLSTKPAARADGKARTITWDNQTISAKSEVTFSLQVRVATDAPNGYLLQNSAIVNGDGIRASATDATLVQGIVPQIAGASIQPITAAPLSAKTGLPIDTLSMLLSLSGSVATAGTLLVKRLI